MNLHEKKDYQLVKAYIRPRPLTRDEVQLRVSNVVERITQQEITIKSGVMGKKYSFDRVFNDQSTQAEIYNVVVSPLIDYIISGYNCTVFAYGQTGTGKTYTMVGEDLELMNNEFDEQLSTGMTPRAAAHLFKKLSLLDPKIEYNIRVSFIEIYNEEVRDLIVPNGTPLRIFEDPDNRGSVCIKGLTEASVASIHDVFDLLQTGIRERQTAATNLNRHSSRSHTIFTLIIFTREVTIEGEELIKTGKLHLVDLAGSENIGRSGATEMRAREAGTINKSLLTLGKVIKALALKSQHIPYRDSKLTRILQDSLGGNTKTCMIATISPCLNAWDETVSTLDYAHAARSVANCPHVNINRKQASVLKSLKDEINTLRAELEVARTGEGFYMTYDSYNKITEDMKRNGERIPVLMSQIKELESMKTKEEEKRKHLMAYFEQRDEKLTATANHLLAVCEKASMHAAIYYSKYENQCSITLRNANVAESTNLKAINALSEVNSTVEPFTSFQNNVFEEISRNSHSLTELHASNRASLGNILDVLLVNLKQFTSDLNENIRNYRSDEFSTESAEKYIFNSLDLTKVDETALKDSTRASRKEMLKISTDLRESIDQASSDQRELLATNSAILTKLRDEIQTRSDKLEEEARAIKQLNALVNEVLEQQQSFDEKKHLTAIGNKFNGFNQSLSKFKQMAYQKTNDFLGTTENKWHNNLSLVKKRVGSYMTDLFDKIDSNLSHHSKNCDETIAKITEETQTVESNVTRGLTTELEHIVTAAACGLSNQDKFTSDIAVLVKRKTEMITKEGHSVVSKVHNGDTPARENFKYPTRIEERIAGQALIEAFEQNGSE